MVSQDLRENGHRLFKAQRYLEALPLLESATESYPEDESLWQELVLSASWGGQHEQAMAFAMQAIQRHSHSDWLWRQLGSELLVLDRLEDTEKALNYARDLNPNDEWLWRYFSRLYQKRKDYAAEARALEQLNTLGKANGYDLNQLGIAYHNHGNFAQAVTYYRLSVAASPDPAPLFNMGLVFNNPEVSQDVDAADAYRRALELKQDYDSARAQLDSTSQKLLSLATLARTTAMGLIRSAEYYQFYISPFEVLKITQVKSVEELDARTIQRAKKFLFQEIELNNGKISWLGNHIIDKSYALTLEDELHDRTKRRYHWTVFENKPLLRFLTLGDIEHFLYSADYFPQDTLDLLDKDPAFRSFLSKTFARQYNFVLTRAIEQQLLPVVEALFDGRRWVEPRDEDICFEGAFKCIDNLMALIRAKVEEGNQRKVSIEEMKEFFRQHTLPELFNLLPTAFRRAQTDVVAAIRSLAISCYNKHKDSYLSLAVLNLSKQFRFKSFGLNQQINEDFKTIESLIAEERKYEVRLTFGSQRPFEITKEGIRDGVKFFPAGTIRALCWGVTITRDAGTQYDPGTAGYQYVFNVKNDENETISVSWSPNKDSEEKQEEFFSHMISAALNYLVEAAVDKIRRNLLNDYSVMVGPCVLNRLGISFQTPGLIFRKDRFLRWRDVSTQIHNGQIIISCASQPQVTIAVPMCDTDNAVLLPIISQMMGKEEA